LRVVLVGVVTVTLLAVALEVIEHLLAHLGVELPLKLLYP
jgi:hypothetical protein